MEQETKRKEWTKDEMLFLEQNYGDMPSRVIADKLDKTTTSVRIKASRLGYSNRDQSSWRKSRPEHTTPNGTILTRATYLERLKSSETRLKFAKSLGYAGAGGLNHLHKVVFGFKESYTELKSRKSAVGFWDTIEILEFVHSFLLKKRFAPSFAEISNALKIKRYHLRGFWADMKKQGLVEGMKDRELHLTDKGIRMIYGDDYFDTVEEEFILDYDVNITT